MSICSECAEDKNLSWPLAHCATFWVGECDYCKKEKGVCADNDWDWPKQKVEDREF